jgi:hypothetical protein
MSSMQNLPTPAPLFAHTDGPLQPLFTSRTASQEDGHQARTSRKTNLYLKMRSKGFETDCCLF